MTDRVTQILREMIVPGPSPAFLGPFLEERDIPECTEGCRPSLLARHTAGYVFSGLLVQVKLKLVFETLCGTGAVRERRQLDEQSFCPARNLHLRAFNNKVNCRRQAVPLRLFLLEASASCSCKRIEFRLSSCLSLCPFSLNQGLLFQPVECRIQGTLLDLQHLAGNLLNEFCDGPSVLGLKGEGLQDEEIECALDEIVWFTHTMTVYTSLL